MRRALGFIVIATVLTIGVAWAATLVPVGVPQWFKGGFNVGTDTNSALSQHRLTRQRFCDVDYDFPSATIVANDSAAASCPGVKVGDNCTATFGPRDGGVQIVTANIGLMAFSDAVDTVKVRAFPVGTAANPVDAGYVVECHSTN